MTEKPAGVAIGERLAVDVIDAAWSGFDEHGDRNVGRAPLWLATEALDEVGGGLWYLKQVLDVLQRGPAGQERIYLSGPYSSTDRDRRDLNVERARQAAGVLLRRGHWPFCPHTMTEGFEDTFPDIQWMTYITADLAWLPFCHSMLMLPDWQASRGSCIEREAAEALHLTIYEDLNEVPNLRLCAKAAQSNANRAEEERSCAPAQRSSPSATSSAGNARHSSSSTATRTAPTGREETTGR